MNADKHILVVDDEPEMCEAIEEYLQLRGFRVSVAGDGAAMKAILASDPADLVLLDLTLPGEDGIELTRQLKASSPIGVIIVSAHSDSEDRVLGLETGADDYVVKPFNFRELLARINSVLRRSGSAGDRPPASGPAPLVAVGAWLFDPVKQTLSKTDGSEAELSSGELDLLRILVENANRPLSRDELLEKSVHRDWEPFDRSIDVKIARLRRKIEVNPAKPQVIKTVRSVGYVLISHPA
ncbi:MAG: hypothetical protein ETSY1_08475 [Candidatus Entotheonella factor]|uniref:Chemotaxis protein CheY n=1 Tax=Entotheonella factor TaxID=1429438 RepID=W4LTG3_ENTF1|nr:MAG: hypothetical protein ETSY1_08475 [Candidatus Entotheonella factor]